MVLLGASGHGKVVAEIYEACFSEASCHFVDKKDITTFFNRQVLRESSIREGEELFISIGNNGIRKELALRYAAHPFSTLVHPRANVSPSVSLGAGTVVMAGASINAETRIGEHVILNTNCSVDHDCRLHDFVHISPNVALAGNVLVGEGAHIGIGASVIQGITIGKWSIVGAGAVIISDVPDYAVVVGVPGKVIKYVEKR
jgi:acetyltransferase EpsM